MTRVLDRMKNEIELLDRHIKILRVIVRNGPIGIVKLSKKTGLPLHQVRYSMRILQQHGFLSPTTRGALANSRAKAFLSEFDSYKKKLLCKIKRI